MEIRGITVAEFEAVVSDVSTSMYSGNVVCEWRKRWVGSPTMLNARGDAFRGRIVVLDSSGAGARRSRSGRRMPAACWHVFRDVVRATFMVAPGARFRTALARYDAATFERTYPATGSKNVGSAFQPVTMPELCECDDSGDVGPSDILPATVGAADWGTVTQWERRLDAVARAEAGRCAWCHGPTLGVESMWCSPEHYEQWQAKYAVQ